jgi:hypothetical protein
LVEETIEATLAPGQPLTVVELARAVILRRLPSGLVSTRMVAVRVEVLLLAHPDRFLEVAPGRWVRRGDGPEAGVASRRPRRPLAGGAAAMATPPGEPPNADAVAQVRLAAG